MVSFLERLSYHYLGTIGCEAMEGINFSMNEG